MGLIDALTKTYQAHADPENAEHMKAYMKDKFEFFGIKAAQRRSLMRMVVDKHRLEIRDTIRSLAFDLYDQPQREMHMVAMELFERQLRHSYIKEDIVLIEKLIITNSWWDSVDYIAKNILGRYLQVFHEVRDAVINRFSDSEDLWLRRSAIIFQLGYKDATDKEVLFGQCLKHKDSTEFFIQKAIGWALREYGKHNPKDVLAFVTSADLKPLSKREAIRLLV